MRKLIVGALLASAVTLVAPATAEAQDRAGLLRQAQAAYDDFDPARAIRIARSALNPALGPLDSTWARGVQLMAQILIEERQEETAKLWARWALRQQPDFPIDSANFVAGVKNALLEARAGTAPTAADAATTATYAWPAANSTSNEARIRVSEASSQLNVLVRGVGLAGPEGLAVNPGTYELEISGQGFLPMRVSREALPGVTATFTFRLTSAQVAAAALADDVRARLFAATVPLNVTRFGGAPAACAAGVASGGERLVLTSYHAIRGADAIAANGDVKVAAWDVTANLAVLVLPAAARDTLAATTELIETQALWGVALAECATPSDSRVVLQGWEGRPLGSLVLSAPPTATEGSPLVDYRGNVAGTWSAGLRAAPSTVIAPLIARAKENVAAGNVKTPAEVATQENHRYGVVIVAVDVPNASVRVTPLEAWQWQELASSGTAPFTFRGAAGRYRIEASAPDGTSRTQEVTARAGETVRTSISLRAVVAANPQQAAQPARRGIPKWAWAAGIGGVAVLALAGGGGGGSSGGTIVFDVQNP